MSVSEFCTKGSIDALHARHEVASCGTRKLERQWWTEFETATNWNAGSNQAACWHQCKLAAPVDAQVNLRDIVQQHHNEQTLRYGRAAPGRARTKS